MMSACATTHKNPALHLDGMLKDTSEMTWFFSPLDLNPISVGIETVGFIFSWHNMQETNFLIGTPVPAPFPLVLVDGQSNDTGVRKGACLPHSGPQEFV